MPASEIKKVRSKKISSDGGRKEKKICMQKRLMAKETVFSSMERTYGEYMHLQPNWKTL